MAKNRESRLQKEVTALRRVCGEMYQVAGVLGATANVLDNLSAASSGRPIPHASVLPYPDHAPDASLLAALKRLAHVAVWDEDSDREEFDAAYQQAEAAIAKAEGTDPPTVHDAMVALKLAIAKAEGR